MINEQARAPVWQPTLYYFHIGVSFEIVLDIRVPLIIKKSNSLKAMARGRKNS